MEDKETMVYSLIYSNKIYIKELIVAKCDIYYIDICIYYIDICIYYKYNSNFSINKSKWIMIKMEITY